MKPLLTTTPPTPLTPRETEVCKLLADGFFGHEVANRLDIGRRTVWKHVEHVRQKLGAISTVQAVCIVALREQAAAQMTNKDSEKSGVF